MKNKNITNKLVFNSKTAYIVLTILIIVGVMIGIKEGLFI